jgi:hypothetical protein
LISGKPNTETGVSNEAMDGLCIVLGVAFDVVPAAAEDRFNGARAAMVIVMSYGLGTYAGMDANCGPSAKYPSVANSRVNP